MVENGALKGEKEMKGEEGSAGGRGGDPWNNRNRRKSRMLRDGCARVDGDVRGVSLTLLVYTYLHQ